jgi:hypothetical protein
MFKKSIVGGQSRTYNTLTEIAWFGILDLHSGEERIFFIIIIRAYNQ